MSEHSTWMGLNILGEDSRVRRGGRDGRSSSGYSQEQPCKRSKDGGEGEGGRWATRKSRGGKSGRRGGVWVTTPYSHDGFVSLATHDRRTEAGGREHSVGRIGNRSHIFPGWLTVRQVRARTGVMLIDPSVSLTTPIAHYKMPDRYLWKQQSTRWNDLE